MNRISILFGALLLATNSFAAAPIESNGIQAITYNDGVLFEASDDAANYQLNVSGVDNPAFKREYTGAGYIFVDATDDQGKPLSDGLYKYEARPMPAVTISRAESSSMPDRNTLVGKSTPKVSPTSGSFRVLNGSVVEPMIEEDNANALQGESE